MRLIEQIRETMERAPAEGSGDTIRLNQEAMDVEVRLADWDRLGCLLEGIHLKMSGEPLSLPDPCSFVDKITYLGERLKVVETEHGWGHATLRSDPPMKNDQTISYFEMSVDRKEGLSLVRFTYDRRRQERSAVATPLTREILERLLVDLSALMRPSV